MRSQRVAAVLSRRRGLIRFTPRRARALMLFDPCAFGARLPQKRVAVPRPCVTASLLPSAVVKAPVSKPDSCPVSRGLHFTPKVLTFPGSLFYHQLQTARYSAA